MLKNLIYMDYHGNQPINLSDEAYEQIKALIETGKVCKECESHYDASNPELARNVCLKCFVSQDRYNHMTYVGPYDYETTYASITSHYHYEQLMDSNGHIHIISPDLGQNEAKKDEALTMQHWGFQLPEQVVRDSEIIILHRSEWSIYGDIHNPVIVGVNNQNNYHGNKTFAFLLYKDQEALELNKRKGDTRNLFKEAKKRLEAAKEPNGDWKSFEGYRFCYEPYDVHHYAWIAQIEMERMEERKVQAMQSVSASHVKKPIQKPSFGDANWVKVALENMRPWEKALWRDVLEAEKKA